MKTSLRRATLSDVQTLLDINYASFEANEAFDEYIDMDWIHSFDAKKHFTDAVTKKDHHTTIVEVDGKPVGYIVLAPKYVSYRKAKILEVDNMSVLPEFRSKGVGNTLMSEAKQWATKQGYQTLFVNAYIKNEQAVAFYKKQGFAPIDISLEHELV